MLEQGLIIINLGSRLKWVEMCCAQGLVKNDGLEKYICRALLAAMQLKVYFGYVE